MVVFGEGYDNVEVFTDVLADDLIFEAGNEVTGTDEEVVLFSLAAFESNAVYITVEVEDYVVAVFNSAVGDVDGTSVALTNGFDFSVNSFVGDFNCVLGCGDTLVFGNNNFRLYENLSGDNNAGFVDCLDIDVRSADNVKTCFLNCFGVSSGENSVDSIFVESAYAIHSFDHLTGSFALSEAGNSELGYVLSVCFFAFCFKSFMIDENFNFFLICADFGNIQYFHFVLHGI